MALTQQTDRYNSAETRDYLNERGSRYRRNVIALSTAAMASAWLPGLHLDANSIPFVGVEDTTWLWIAVGGVIAFNAIFMAFHAWQDLTLMQREFHAIHLGQPTVFVTGEPLHEYRDDGEISATYHRGGTAGTDFRVMYRETAGEKKPDGSPHYGGNNRKGLLVGPQDYLHLLRKRRFFFAAEIALPAVLFVLGMIAITSEALADTVDTPEPSKYGNAKCAYEAQLGDRASAFTNNIITTRNIEIERSGKNDKYGRALAKVRVGDEYLGDMLIDAGLAMPWTGRQFDWCGSR